MTVDLHSAVRTAVDEARRLAKGAHGGWGPHSWTLRAERHAVDYGQIPIVRDELYVTTTAEHVAFWDPRRALAMCDWADDVLARHVGEPFLSYEVCKYCHLRWPCCDLVVVAAAFGVETGETE